MHIEDLRLEELADLKTRVKHAELAAEAEARRVDELTKAIRKVHAAKGRYHNQPAMCELFELVGLKGERP